MKNIRPPAVAGRFYPAEPTRLRSLVEGYIAEGQRSEVVPKAMIVPHAGYPYSGPIAGSGYAHLANCAGLIRRIILMGPAHFVPVQGLALSEVDGFATPLGIISLDADGCRVAAAAPGVKLFEEAHRPEHCLEVQLPFLQISCPGVTIIPLLIGEASAGDVAGVLTTLWGGSETLILISSDLSHYHDYGQARRLDQETAADIEALRPLRPEQACGYAAVNGLLEMARRRDLTVRTADLRSSGDTAGSPQRVVGYGAFIFSRN